MLARLLSIRRTHRRPNMRLLTAKSTSSGVGTHRLATTIESWLYLAPRAPTRGRRRFARMPLSPRPVDRHGVRSRDTSQARSAC